MSDFKSIADVPEMLELWDFDKNPENPKTVSSISRLPYYWKCKLCGYEWPTTPRTRTRTKGKCPACKGTGKRPDTVKDIPFLMEQWDFSKNTVDPATILISSKKKFFWKCKKCGKEWPTSPQSRYDAKGKCPSCDSNKSVQPGVNDVFTLVPELKKIYDFEKNEGFDIEHQGWSSREPIACKCPDCGREWSTIINSQIRKNGDSYELVGCDHKNRNRRKYIPTVSERPNLMHFWDTEKNNLDPATTSSATEDPAYWNCPDCGYSWSGSIRARDRSNSGECPCCKTQKVLIPGVNDALTLLPDLKRLYNFRKNEELGLDPFSFRLGEQNIYCWWKCPDCGYEWNSTISSRLDRKDGKIIVRQCQNCYYNDPSRITPVASMPKLMRFWDFKENKKHGLDPNLVSAYSPLPANWHCKKCDYRWPATIRSRARTPDACPFCDSHNVIIPGKNDVLTLLPDFANFYDFDTNEANGIDIRKRGISSSQSVHYRCKNCNYEWDGPIAGRIGTDILGNKFVFECPSCRDRSATTRRVPYSLAYPKLVDLYNTEHNICQLDDITTAQARNRLFYWTCPDCHTDFTAYIATIIHALENITSICPKCSGTNSSPDESFASEYPEYLDAYADTDIDPYTVAPYSSIMVTWQCKNGHIRDDSFWRIAHSGIDCPICKGTKLVKGVNTFADYFPQYIPMYSPNNIWKPDEIFYDSRRWLKWICNICHGEYGAYVKEIVNGKECPFCSDKYPLPGFNTLAVKHPDIAAIWSDKNEISADETLVNGNYAIWTCPVCHGNYNAPIKDVVDGKANCPYCNDRKVLPGFNSLAAKYPDIAAIWSDKNQFSADQILPNTTMAFWTCPTCHGDYPARINKVINGKVECPYCNNKKVLPGFNSLAVKYPDIANMWSTQNKLSADQVLPNVNYALWTCPTCHGDYSARIIEVVNGETNCPYCNNRKLLPGFNSLAVKHPDIAKMWSKQNRFSADQVLPNTNMATWTCPTCHGNYSARIIDVINGEVDCPYCNDRKVLPGFNSLADKYPDIAKMWSKQNRFSADQVLPNTNMATWTCPTCHGDYSARIIDMINGKVDCPYCNDRKVLPGFNSLAVKHPDIAKMWSKQNRFSADQVLPNINIATWTCPTCHGDYSARIIEVINGEAECPYCNNKKLLSGFNSLADKYPDIVNLWSDQNELSPNQVLPNTTIATWTCPTCRENYPARIIDVINGIADCPYCSGRKALPGKTSFAALHPDLMEDWDFIANYCLVNPDEILDTYSQKVWWNCKRSSEHKYPLSPADKVFYQKRHRESCPYCKGRRRKKKFF